MRITLDTNVLIASIISRGTCHELVEYVLRAHISVGSDFIRNEAIEKLISKFHFSANESKIAINHLYERTEVVVPNDYPSSVRVTDKDDIKVVGTGISGKCELLITGDKELLALREIDGLKIVSPSDSWRLI